MTREEAFELMDEQDIQAKAAAIAMFDEVAPSVAEVVRVIEAIARTWPMADRTWEALIGTLNVAACYLDTDAGRGRGRVRPILKTPTSEDLWRDQERRNQPDEEDES